MGMFGREQNLKLPTDHEKTLGTKYKNEFLNFLSVDYSSYDLVTPLHMSLNIS